MPDSIFKHFVRVQAIFDRIFHAFATPINIPRAAASIGLRSLLSRTEFSECCDRRIQRELGYRWSLFQNCSTVKLPPLIVWNYSCRRRLQHHLYHRLGIFFNCPRSHDVGSSWPAPSHATSWTIISFKPSEMDLNRPSRKSHVMSGQNLIKSPLTSYSMASARGC